MVVGSLLLIVAAVALLGYGLVQGANAAFVASIAASLLAAVALIVGGRKAAAAREDQREIQQERERRRAARAAETARGGSAGGDEFDLADSRRGRMDEDRQPVAVGAGAVGHADEASIFTAPREDAPYREETAYRDETPYRDDAGYRDETPYRDDAGYRDETPYRDDAGYPDETPHRDETAYRAQGSYREDYPTGERGIPTQSAAGADQGYPDDDDDDDEEPPNEPPAQLTSPGDAARVARMSTEVLVVDGRPRYHKPGCVHLLGRQSEPLPVSEAVELGFTPCSLCEPDSALLAEARRV